jgi:hypothetical protein
MVVTIDVWAVSLLTMLIDSVYFGDKRAKWQLLAQLLHITHAVGAALSHWLNGGTAR